MKNGKFALIGFLLAGCAAQQNHRETQSPEVLINMAESMKKSGQVTSALSMYEQALISNPKHVKAAVGLATLLTHLERYDQAITVLENYLTKYPHLEESDDIRKELGKVYIAAHKPVEGIKHYQEILQHDPEDIWAMTGLGVCLDLNAQYGLAQTWYRKALEKSPDNMKILSNYGLSLALSGNYQESLDVLVPLSKNPEATVNVRHNLATAYALSGKKDLAHKFYMADLTPEEANRNLKKLDMMH